MRKILLSLAGLMAAGSITAQIKFDPSIDTVYDPVTAVLPKSPLRSQVLFIGGYHKVQTTATYGNQAGEALAKQWHDFIGFTPDNSGSGDLGWVSVNHEMIVQNDSIGDGGGMTVFKLRRDSNDSLIVVPQTLTDGRSGEFFAVDFANTTGETGMNCGGITGPTGRIWTAEEWFRSGNGSIADRDTGLFTIGTGTATQAAPAGFPGFNGESMKKFQNYNYMVEIDPKEAVAVRKQYNWGRQPFEGGTIMADNKTAYLGADNTPGFFTKFVANTAGDFTSGKTYVYKHDGSSSKWVEIDNTDFNKMLNFADEAVSADATMYNRLEWVTNIGGKVYMTETGRSNPGGRWADELADGAVLAPHHIARATAQGTTADAGDYLDFYGRILVYDPATNEISVFLEGGPDLSNAGQDTTSPAVNAYPDKHLSNPDGLNAMTIHGQDYLIICEDLNQNTFGSAPAGKGRTCELFLLDLSINNPSVTDLIRIAVVPQGAEVTGAVAIDERTILVNSQHPSSSNPFPYNNSLTLAISGFDANPLSVQEYELEDGFSIYPNPVARELNFSRMTDVAIYNTNGQRIRVYRNRKSIDVSGLAAGVYYVQNDAGQTFKFVVE